jgi:hypothetical protein
LGRAALAHAALTRRRSTDTREERWHFYHGDVHADTIIEQAASWRDVLDV